MTRLWCVTTTADRVMAGAPLTAHLVVSFDSVRRRGEERGVGRVTGRNLRLPSGPLLLPLEDRDPNRLVARNTSNFTWDMLAHHIIYSDAEGQNIGDFLEEADLSLAVTAGAGAWLPESVWVMFERQEHRTQPGREDTRYQHAFMACAIPRWPKDSWLSTDTSRGQTSYSLLDIFKRGVTF